MAGRNVTKIVHAAVFTAVRQDIERDRSRSIADINLAGTLNLLDLALTLSMDRFLYVSSGSVYGEGPGPGTAPSRGRYPLSTHPVRLHQVCQRVANPQVRGAARVPDGEHTPQLTVRSHGAGDGSTGAVMSVFYEWTRDAVRGDAIRVGDRSASRDYTYVADTAAAVSSVLDAPSLSYDVYNVAAGPAYTLDQIIQALKEARPSLKVIDDPAHEVRSLRPDSARGPMDVTRLFEDVPFAPSYDLAAGVREYLEWREDLRIPRLTGTSLWQTCMADVVRTRGRAIPTPASETPTGMSSSCDPGKNRCS